MALTNKLSAIGNAIREKTGKTELLSLDAMVTEIAAIETGGGGEELPEQFTVFKDTIAYKFYLGSWDWYLDYFGNKLRTENIGAMSHAFYNAKMKKIPFDINCSQTIYGGIDMTNLFYGCSNLTELPRIINCKPGTMSSMFANCTLLREVPEDYVDTFDWYIIDAPGSTAYSNSRASTFDNCKSLRLFPMEILKHGNLKANYSYTLYYKTFTNCKALDEVIGLPVIHGRTDLTTTTYTSNMFNQTFNANTRLKNMTFATKEDGTPYEVAWKSQTIDLSNYIGYCQYDSDVVGNSSNAGLTYDTQITDDASYQALKDNPDSWTLLQQYSRYNHDSAVTTINSLPDASAYLATAGGTNTIKFKGTNGSATDGGAINTLTEEEIAVATAKGWTVSLT